MTTATANKNEELIRAGYEAFGRGDIAVFQGLFTPDITWHVGGRNPLSGDKRGLEATLELGPPLGRGERLLERPRRAPGDPLRAVGAKGLLHAVGVKTSIGASEDVSLAATILRGLGLASARQRG